MEKDVEKIPRDRLLFKEFITSLIALSVLSWAALIFSAPLSAPGGELAPVGMAVSFLVLLPLEERLPGSSRRVSTILFILLVISAITPTLYGFLR
jgi:multisubunit Na+/H+ antiporter MnhB subunit